MNRSICKTAYGQVLAALIAGALTGHLWPGLGSSLKPLGDVFTRSVQMLIAPILFCTIALGIAKVSDPKAVGRTLLKAMGLFYLLTCLALGLGVAAVYLLEPGAGMHIQPALLDSTVSAQAAGGGIAAPSAGGLMRHLIPATFVGAFAGKEVLPVLLLAVLFGFALARMGGAAELVIRVLDALSAALFTMFGYVMRIAPLGAFGAMAFTIGKYGIKSIGPLGWLIGTFYLTCAVFVLLVLGPLARLHGFSLFKLLRYFKEEFAVVLGTASTEPVLPRVLEKLERLGCSGRISGLVLPMGYSFNLDGSAIYLSLATLFIAQACDIKLTAGRVAAMLAIMILTSKGTAGVTGSGFLALVATLGFMPEIPVAGVALIVGIDRLMSEARAITSLISNTVAALVVALSERACDRATLLRELDLGFIGDDERAAALPSAGPPQPSRGREA